MARLRSCASRSVRPTLGELRIGECDPGHRVVVGFDRQAEQRVPDHQSGMIIGDMGELQRACGVADRIDALVGGAQALVDDDAVRAMRRCRRR